MYLVVGLGNPGKQYEATRHNMGFDTVDRLVEDYNVPQGGVKFNAMYGKTMIGGHAEGQESPEECLLRVRGVFYRISL